jgi:hypothetical protein
MSVSLRDLQRAKHSLRAQCRLHPAERAATCPECHDAALRQQLSQGMKERQVAHIEYLQRLGAPR